MLLINLKVTGQLREVIQQILEKKRIVIKQLILSGRKVATNASTGGTTSRFPILIGLHQSSDLSPFFFILLLMSFLNRLTTQNKFNGYYQVMVLINHDKISSGSKLIHRSLVQKFQDKQKYNQIYRIGVKQRKDEDSLHGKTIVTRIADPPHRTAIRIAHNDSQWVLDPDSRQ